MENTNVKIEALTTTLTDEVCDFVKNGKKIPNGIYSTLSKGEKKTVNLARRMRKDAVIETSARFLSGEIVREGWVAEKAETQIMARGIQKMTLVAYKRPSRGRAIATLNTEELLKVLSPEQVAELVKNVATAALVAVK